jgi:hypothetical protein
MLGGPVAYPFTNALNNMLESSLTNQNRGRVMEYLDVLYENITYLIIVGLEQDWNSKSLEYLMNQFRIYYYILIHYFIGASKKTRIATKQLPRVTAPI